MFVCVCVCVCVYDSVVGGSFHLTATTAHGLFLFFCFFS